MNQFQTLAGKSWAQFDEFKLDLTPRGVTYVRGRNDDAGGNPNGAGKSSLVNALYALAFGNHQLAVRKKSLSSIVTSETSLSLSVRTSEHSLRALMHGIDFKLKVDGEAVEARQSKRGDERERFLNELRLTPELYSASVHINGVAGSPILRGTSAQRCQFLERAFDLDRWMDAHSRVSDVISQMKRADADLQEAQIALAALTPDSDLKAKRERLAELSGREKLLRANASKLIAEIARVKSMPPRPERSSADVRAAINKLERTLDGAADAREMADWREARRRRDEARDEVVRLQQDLTADVVFKIEDVEKAATDARAALESAESKIKHASAVRAWRSAAVSIARRHGMKFRDLNHLRSMSESWVANLKSGSSACPVCGGTFSSKVTGAELDDVEMLLSRLPERLPDLNADDPDIDKLRARAKRAESELVTARAQAGVVAAIKSAKRDADAQLPPKPEGEVIDVAASVRKLADLRRELTDALVWRDADDHEDVGALRKKSDKVEAELESLREESILLRDQVSRAEAQAEMRGKLRERVELLQGEVSLRPVYRALQQAYSPNGMRLWLLQELVEQIVQGMNSHAHSSRDRMTFGYKLSRNRDLLLTASNIRGTYDIRMLSGAESSFFILNFLSVVLPLLPSSRRSSILILDEIDGQCSAQSRAVIAQEYLPRLSKIVDCIYVVTPSTPAMFSSQGAREALVVKRGGRSTLNQ